MSDLSQDQEERRASIQKTATVWGVILGAIAGLLALWLLGGQGGAVRFGGAIVVALGVGFLVFRASFNSGAKSAKCEKCGAAFSRARSDHAETLISSTPKETREEQADKSIKVTSWTEDALDVLDTYTCAKCGDITTKSYQTTRRRDETSVTEQAPQAQRGAQSTKGAAAVAKSGKSAPANPRGSQSRKG